MMATTLLISKADFAAANLVKFSANIEEAQLNPFIYAAQEYDLEPKLGADLYNAAVNYAGSPDGSRPELNGFIAKQVARFLVLTAYKRFISSHGINITQFGVTKTADPQGTFSQVEAGERAVILRQIDSDCSVATIKMLNVDFTFDGVTYTKSGKATAPSASIRAPRRRRALLVSSGFSYLDIIK